MNDSNVPIIGVQQVDSIPTESTIQSSNQPSEPQQPPKPMFFKTKLIYIDRCNETITSVRAPSINPNDRTLQFLLTDRLIGINLDNVRRWETEQLADLK